MSAAKHIAYDYKRTNIALFDMNVVYFSLYRIDSR